MELIRADAGYSGKLVDWAGFGSWFDLSDGGCAGYSGKLVDWVIQHVVGY